jgi:hypothetical protein
MNEKHLRVRSTKVCISDSRSDGVKWIELTVEFVVYAAMHLMRCARRH